MIISDDKIIEATEAELYDLWLQLGYDDLCSFPDYMKLMQKVGVKVNGGQHVCKDGSSMVV